MLMILLSLDQTNEIIELISDIKSEFKIKDMGRPYFPSIHVNFSKLGIHLSQTAYITNLLLKFGFCNVKACLTLMSKDSSIYDTSGPSYSNPSEFRSALGSLQYLAITR